MVKTLTTKVKRGDTVIEVMFAFAVFALVAILSIAMMNSGIATSERSLELVVARNELNAQAEALRFIHSSYVSELTLPECDYNNSVQNDGKCQQYAPLWKKIIGNAIPASTIPSEITSCQDIYKEENGSNSLSKNKAFIINLRNLNIDKRKYDIRDKVNQVYISANSTIAQDVFQPAPLGARIVYSTRNSLLQEEDITSSVQQDGYNPANYTNLIRAEGIWVVAIEGSKNNNNNNEPLFYDFRIQTCWYGSGNAAPTTLDTVIRLNNPEILK